MDPGCPGGGLPSRNCHICGRSRHWQNCPQKGKARVMMSHLATVHSAMILGTRGRTPPRDHRDSGLNSSPLMALYRRGLGHHLTLGPNSNTTRAEPRATLQVAGKNICNLLDTRAPFLFSTSFSGSPSSASHLSVGVDGKSTLPQLTSLICCHLEGLLFSHQFMFFPECTSYLLG